MCGIVGAIYGIFGSVLLKYGLLGVPIAGLIAIPILLFTSLIIGVVSIQNEIWGWIFVMLYNLIIFFLIGSLIGYLFGRLKKYGK